MTENPYRRRERLLDELREDLDREAAVLILVDHQEGASVMSQTGDDVHPETGAFLRELAHVLPQLLEQIYYRLGISAVDMVDRSP